MKNWISLAISTVALIASFVAVARLAPTQGIDFDYLGVIIGILSFLVTLLIGYQIYTVIDVKEELKEVRQLRKEIDEKMKANADELSDEFRSELGMSAPLIMALGSSDSGFVESAAFDAYYKSKPGQLTRELAGQTIRIMLSSIVQADEAERKQKLDEMARNVRYEHVVEFYTDFAKTGDKSQYQGVESFLLDLIGKLTNDYEDKQ